MNAVVSLALATSYSDTVSRDPCQTHAGIGLMEYVCVCFPDKGEWATTVFFTVCQETAAKMEEDKKNKQTPEYF